MCVLNGHICIYSSQCFSAFCYKRLILHIHPSKHAKWTACVWQNTFVCAWYQIKYFFWTRRPRLNQACRVSLNCIRHIPPNLNSFPLCEILVYEQLRELLNLLPFNFSQFFLIDQTVKINFPPFGMTRGKEKIYSTHSTTHTPDTESITPLLS